jgi:hypothetical protein
MSNELVASQVSIAAVGMIGLLIFAVIVGFIFGLAVGYAAGEEETKQNERAAQPPRDSNQRPAP